MGNITANQRIFTDLQIKYPLNCNVFRTDSNGEFLRKSNFNLINTIEYDCRKHNLKQLTNVYLRKERRQRLFDLAKEVKSQIDFLKDCQHEIN